MSHSSRVTRLHAHMVVQTKPCRASCKPKTSPTKNARAAQCSMTVYSQKNGPTLRPVTLLKPEYLSHLGCACRRPGRRGRLAEPPQPPWLWQPRWLPRPLWARQPLWVRPPRQQKHPQTAAAVSRWSPLHLLLRPAKTQAPVMTNLGQQDSNHFVSQAKTTTGMCQSGRRAPDARTVTLTTC
jgi:hypothetical protein